MPQRNVLYRFFDGDGVLLYIGISMTPWMRFRQHRHEKEWWDDIATITKENYPSRSSVLGAEQEAIENEHPLYNVTHNRRTGGATLSGSPITTPFSNPHTPVYAFQSRRSGTMHSDLLTLQWEIDGMSISDDYLPQELSAAELFGIWRDRYAHDLSEPLKIWWFIGGPRTKIEYASMADDDPDAHHWLRYYTLPMILPSCKQVSLQSLPVRNLRWSGTRGDKGGFIQEFCGWKPQAFRKSVTGFELVQAAKALRSAVNA